MLDYRSCFDFNRNTLIPDNANHEQYTLFTRLTRLTGGIDFADTMLRKHISCYLAPDGIVVFKRHYASIFGDKPSGVDFNQYPWENVTGLDFRSGRIMIMSGVTEIDGGKPKPTQSLAGGNWDTYLTNLQLSGGIPARVAIAPPVAKQGKAGKPPRPSGLLGFAVFLLILAGAPYVKGNGSFSAAFMVGLADIYPDAVTLAIRNNPQWSTGVRLDLVARATAVQASRLTPSLFATDGWGTIVYIPLWWVETLTTKEWQVRQFADILSDEQNNPKRR